MLLDSAVVRIFTTASILDLVVHSLCLIEALFGVGVSISSMFFSLAFHLAPFKVGVSS